VSLPPLVPATSDACELVSLALAHDDLHRFLAGDAPYFVQARTDNDEPQNIARAFDTQVLPYWRRTSDAAFPGQFTAALMRLLLTWPDRNCAIYLVYGWIWHYRYCLADSHARPDGRYAGLFDLDLDALAVQLRVAAAARRRELMSDTRWAGAAWNSDSGLWAPVLRVAVAVRDRLGGPDAVPEMPDGQ